jgi:hypothetical protein
MGKHFLCSIAHAMPSQALAGRVGVDERLENLVGRVGGRTYGPLIKRCPVDQTQQAQEQVSEQKNKDSE